MWGLLLLPLVLLLLPFAIVARAWQSWDRLGWCVARSRYPYEESPFKVWRRQEWSILKQDCREIAHECWPLLFALIALLALALV